MFDKVLANRPLAVSLALFVISSLTILAALGFEHIGGYKPCELCFLQRKAWYFLIVFSLVLIFLAASGKAGLARAGLFAAGLILLGEAAFAFWHAGIEWKWWTGPASCTGGAGLSGGLPDLSTKVVLCDEVAIRILGLSFAGWNAVLSLATSMMSFAGFRRH